MASNIQCKKVAIIGAGICGISSAICLQSADPSLEITIIAEQFSPNLTSDVAAGFWEPVYLGNTPMAKQRQWGQNTFDYLRSIVDTEEGHKYHMHYITTYLLYDYEVEEIPLNDIFMYCKRLSQDDLKKSFPPDIIDGFLVQSIITPGTPYLNIKLKEFQQRGGRVIQKKVKTFDELGGKYDVVVNCAGVGGRELCKDKMVVPIRGQVLKMKAPFVKTAYIVERKEYLKQEKDLYIFPRFDEVIVGGTVSPGNWDTTVDETQTKEILDRAAEFVPSIKHAELKKTCVGLRPGRDSIRLEKEMVQVQLQHGTKVMLPVIHNYGHGGAGLSLFWGCAQDVRDLVISSLLHSNL